MEPAVPETTEPDVPTDVSPDFTPEDLELARAELLAQQNFPLGLAAGAAAAAVGAVLWAVITVVTEYQIGYMAVGIGFLVGFAVRAAGKGITKTYSILGAALALLGCAFGNLFSSCAFVAKEFELPLLDVLGNVLSDPEVLVDLMQATFSPMDLLFYAIAVYEGYQLSIRKVTADDLKTLVS